MNLTLALALVMAVAGIDFREAKLPPVRTVPRQLDVLLKSGHIQGATCSERGVYLSHQYGIEHIGWDGRLIRHLNAPAHLGDIFCSGGLIYGAFCLRDRASAEKPGMVCVWDEETFAEIRQKRFQEPLDGIVVLNGVVYVGVGEALAAHPGCTVKRLDLNLKQIDEKRIDLGYSIHFGVQTMATDGTHLFFGNYGAKASAENPTAFNCSMLTPDLTVVANTMFGCSEGIGLVPSSVFGRPVFFVVRALNGNMQGWRKDPVKNPPQVELRFYERRL